MSEALYYSLQQKWQDYLNTEFYPNLESYSPDQATKEYDGKSHEFCKQHDYSEKTEEFAFHGRWYDTFADMYYLKLEELGVKIVRPSCQSPELNLQEETK